MLQIKVIRDHASEVVERLRKKKFDAAQIVEQIIQTDEQRRKLQTELDASLAEANQIAQQVGLLYKQGKRDEADSAKQRAAQLKEAQKGMNEQLDVLVKALDEMMVRLPNMPHESVPFGNSADDNVQVRNGGVVPQLSADALPHWDLIKKYDLIDFELGTKLTGSGFPVYKGKGAKLQRALINFFLDQAEKAGYMEVQPPIMVNADSGFGTGQLPDKEGQMYHVQLDNLYLIPTAEVPVTNIYRDVLLDAEQFPIKNTAYTPCFRREAGAWGAHVRGLNRLHQFDKVEIVCIEHPDRSYQRLEEMVAHVESLVKQLELPYRILRLCGGDMGFTSSLTYDFEVYSAAQKRWLEVSSVSNFETYQANRLKLRFREKGSKQSQLAHTLNGSALALPRIVAALIENNQTPEGIRIPAVLQRYTGFDLMS